MAAVQQSKKIRLAGEAGLFIFGNIVHPYFYIQKQHQFDLAITQLKHAKRIAIDTESSGFYTYFPELCLIQLSGGDVNYVVDTLTGLDLTGLRGLCADPSIQKIFHSAPSDIQEIYRAYRWEFNTIFDTFLGCRMLGFDACSLASLVKHFFGVELEKKEQKSNWKKRPLTRSQLNYASLDTVYLETIMEKMQEELRQFGLVEEIEQEFDWIVKTQYQPQEKTYDADAWKYLNGVIHMSPFDRGCLKVLFDFRDQRARGLNIAPFRLFSNQAMLDIIKRKPQSINDLKRIRSVNSDFFVKEGEYLLDLLSGVEEIHDGDLNSYYRFDPVLEDRFKRLKKWRQQTADYRGMDSSVILSNRVLRKIAEAVPKSYDEIAAFKLMTKWKLDHYAKPLLNVMAGSPIEENLPDVARLPEERRRARNEAESAKLGSSGRGLR